MGQYSRFGTDLRRTTLGIVVAGVLTFASPATAMSDTGEESVPATVSIMDTFPAPVIAGPSAVQTPPRSLHLLRVLTYVLQIADAMTSANATNRINAHCRCHAFETNSAMQPFSHGGALTMLAGFAIGDLVRNAMFRRSAPAVQIGIEEAQATQNLVGMLKTFATERSALAP